MCSTPALLDSSLTHCMLPVTAEYSLPNSTNYDRYCAAAQRWIEYHDRSAPLGQLTMQDGKTMPDGQSTHTHFLKAALSSAGRLLTKLPICRITACGNGLPPAVAKYNMSPKQITSRSGTPVILLVLTHLLLHIRESYSHEVSSK